MQEDAGEEERRGRHFYELARTCHSRGSRRGTRSIPRIYFELGCLPPWREYISENVGRFHEVQMLSLLIFRLARYPTELVYKYIYIQKKRLSVDVIRYWEIYV